MKQFGKKLLMAVAALGLTVTLAACGSSSASSSSSSEATSSSQTTTSASAAVKKANKLISEGKYQAALNTLNKVDKDTSASKALKKDLKNYLAAKQNVKKQDYDSAATSLSTVKSSSSTMKSAYSKLRSQIASSSSSSVAASASSSSSSSTTTATTNASSSSSSQAAANSSVASATSEDVLSSFASQAGFNKEGYGIIPVSKNGNVYRFEVRQDNSDNTVANFVGIYDYNSVTKQISQVQ